MNNTLRVFVIAILLTPIACFSQKTENINVVSLRTGQLNITAHVHFTDNKQPDTTFSLGGRDWQYQYINTYITLKSGTAQEVFDFLKFALKFLIEEKNNTSISHSGNYMVVNKSIGNSVLIFENKNISPGSISFNESTITSLLSKLEYWSKKHNIPIIDTSF